MLVDGYFGKIRYRSHNLIIKTIGFLQNQQFWSTYLFWFDESGQSLPDRMHAYIPYICTNIPFQEALEIN